MENNRRNIEISIKDSRDLMLLWAALNHIQIIGQRELGTVFMSKHPKLDKANDVWIDETVDEFDRLMTMKAQIGKLLEEAK